MEELNKEIREFQKTVDSSLADEDSTGITANIKAFEDCSGDDLEAIKNLLSDVHSQLAKEEEGYLAEQKMQEQLQKEFDEYEKKMSLIEAITEKTNSVQVLAKQTSELEQILASLGEELQKKCRCQQCQAENLEVLSLLLQGDQDKEVS